MSNNGLGGAFGRAKTGLAALKTTPVARYLQAQFKGFKGQLIIGNSNQISSAASFFTNTSTALPFVEGSVLQSAVTTASTATTVTGVRVAYSPFNGDFIIANGNNGNTLEIRRYSSIGVLQGAAITISTNSSGTQQYGFDVAFSPLNGDFVVTYLSAAGAPTFARYSAAGVLQGAETTVNGAAASYIGVDYSKTNGEFMVVYPPSATNVNFARYSAAGVLQGAVTNIATLSSVGPMDVCGLADGRYVFAYADTGNNQVNYRVYDSVGVAVGAAANVTTLPQTPTGISVDGYADSSFVVLGQVQAEVRLNVFKSFIPQGGGSPYTPVFTGGTFSRNLGQGAVVRVSPVSQELFICYTTLNNLYINRFSDFPFGNVTPSTTLKNFTQLITPLTNTNNVYLDFSPSGDAVISYSTGTQAQFVGISPILDDNTVALGFAQKDFAAGDIVPITKFGAVLCAAGTSSISHKKYTGIDVAAVGSVAYGR